MSFYLKYRPRLVEELDLVRVRESLKKIMEAGKMPKSLLLVGPRGGGKTSTARIVAKVVNCEKNAKGKEGKLKEPCLECEMCTSIERGGAVDVIEMDAASNRGIDAIRELKERINLAPVMAKFKVYIIDEVHMLTSEAFNALLKTLEEPPAHVLFILCTTEEHKVPETIRSRCTKVQFYKAGVEEVKRSLNKAVKGEGLKMTEEALTLLAENVDGSFREGHKLLEVLATAGGEIGEEAVRVVLGVAGDTQVLTEALIAGNTTLALTEIERLAQMGVDWMASCRMMIDYLRLLIKSYYGVGEEQAAWDVRRLMLVINRLAKAAGELKTAVVAQLPLEIAAVELGVQRGGEVEPVAQKEVIPERPTEEVKKPIESKESVRVVSAPVTAKAEVEEEVKVKKKGEDRVKPMGKAVSIAEVQAKWQEILSLLKPKNHSVAGLLRSTKPKAVEDHFLILEVFYKFHKEQLEQDAKRRILEEALVETVGLDAVRLVMGDEQQRPQVLADADLAKKAEEVFGG